MKFSFTSPKNTRGHEWPHNMVCSPFIFSANDNCMTIHLNTFTAMTHTNTVVRTDFCQSKWISVAPGTACSAGWVIEAGSTTSITGKRTWCWTRQTEKPADTTPFISIGWWIGESSAHSDTNISFETEFTGNSHHREECSSSAAWEDRGEWVLCYMLHRCPDNTNTSVPFDITAKLFSSHSTCRKHPSASLFLSACLPPHMEQLNSHWMNCC